MAFCTPSAFAADGAVSRAIPTTKTAATESAADASTDTVARSTVARSSVRRDAINTAASDSTVARTGTSAAGRVVNLSDNAAPASPRDGATAARSQSVSRSVMAGDGATRSNLDAAVNTVGRNSRVTAASINNNPAVRRAGLTLRPSTAEVGGRAHIAGTNAQTGSNLSSEVRAVSSRAAKVTTRESIAEAKERLEQTADLNKSCQEQYNDCMDQFCAVIDANQKRCSCSSNLSKYTKVEKAVKDANAQLNDVAQRIRYVGLSADEIRAIMSATEAEAALSGVSDTTETRNMLEEIEKLIKNPTSTSSYNSDTYTGLDMDLDFSSDIADLFNLDFLNTGTASFSNLRGADLYNAAKKRCNTILTQCKDVGATSQQITGNYDLAIDKDCIAYEQGLTKMNETLKSNVRSATTMLQKARLAVLQNKNQYDAKGCIAALEACMTDEMVCGSEYTKCLDPTKRYIDENGNVVLGQNITDITAFMENYNSAAIDSAFLTRAYQSQSISVSSCKADKTSDQTSGGNDASCVAKYLMQKIGTKKKVTDEGLCRAVLDKCQNYTYDSNGNYKPYNDVVVNYTQRALVNIRAAQNKIISDYASNCMVDVATCYNQQVTQVNTWSSNASANSVYNVMRGACRNVALTCAYAVFQKDDNNCPVGSSTTDQDTCINSISNMFYQSLLCPDNSSYVTGGGTMGQNGQAGFVNTKCRCNDGFVIWSGSCVAECAADESRNSYGTCVKNKSE